MEPSTIRLSNEHRRREQVIKSMTGKTRSDIYLKALDKEYRAVVKKYKLNE